MSEYTTLSLFKANKVAVITINRLKALNALNETVLDELSMAFDELAVNDAIKAVILTDKGNKAFVAGVDITQQYEIYTSGNCFVSTN
jgi:enoyl-CoA hydratase